MSKKALRVIVVGYGNVGEELTRLLAVEPCCRVVAVVDPSRAALEKATSLYQLSTFPTLGQSLEATDADVAVLATPVRPAFDLALTALEHGLHVLVTRALGDAAGLGAAAKARKRSAGFAHGAASARDYLRKLEAVLRDAARGPASPESR